MRTGSVKRNTINIVTLGCSKNVYDSEVLMGRLKTDDKNVVHEQEGNIVIINTCGFINSAKEKSINTTLDYVQQKEAGLIDKVFVMGCLFKRHKPDLEKEIPDVDQYFGTNELPALPKVLRADYKHELTGERLTATPKNCAYLKISEGCNRPCSSCATPLTRGAHIPTPIEALIIEAGKLTAKGVKELILIAQDITYYGLDLYKERALADLLRALVKIEGIEWICIHYALPTGFSMDVIEVMKEEPEICSYLDIPLQHISDPILASMKRGTIQEKTTKLLKKLREAIPEMVIRTTLIVGYPGETQADFEALKFSAKEMRFDRLSCFAYSHERNTIAYDLEDNVPEKVGFTYANEIMEIQSQISWELNQQKVGKTLRCLTNREEGNYFVGRTEYDSPDAGNGALIDAKKHYVKTGDFVEVKIIDATDHGPYGEPAV